MRRLILFVALLIMLPLAAQAQTLTAVQVMPLTLSQSHSPRWCRDGSTDCPSQFQAFLERLSADTDRSRPFRYALRSALERDAFVGPLVLGLFLACSPAHVAWFVVPGSVRKPVKTVDQRGAKTHISDELVKRIGPRWTDGDTASSVLLVPVRRWIQATAQHGAIAQVRRPARLSNAQRIDRSSSSSVMQTSARLSVSVGQSGQVDQRVSPTDTTTLDSSASCGTRGSFSENRQTAEYSAGNDRLSDAHGNLLGVAVCRSAVGVSALLRSAQYSPATALVP